jgi:hypothetical protein
LGRGGSDVLNGGGGNDRLDAREGAAATAAQAGSGDRVVCGGGTDTALVDPVDLVDPDCENVVGASGSNPPAQNPPAQNPPPGQNPPGQNPPGQNPPPQNQAPTGITLVPASVSENEPVGTRVGTLSASDPDSTSHAFALVPGVGSDDNGSFVIAGSELRTAAMFDYEAKSSYSGADPRQRLRHAGGPDRALVHDHGQ